MDENKQKALSAALSQIEKQFGKGSVMRMGDAPATRDLEVIPTGSLALDAAPPFGLRREDLISREVEPEVVAEGERRYMAWRAARDVAIVAGRTPKRPISS